MSKIIADIKQDIKQERINKGKMMYSTVNPLFPTQSTSGWTYLYAYGSGSNQDTYTINITNSSGSIMYLYWILIGNGGCAGEDGKPQGNNDGGEVGGGQGGGGGGSEVLAGLFSSNNPTETINFVLVKIGLSGEPCYVSFPSITYNDSYLTYQTQLNYDTSTDINNGQPGTNANEFDEAGSGGNGGAGVNSYTSLSNPEPGVIYYSQANENCNCSCRYAGGGGGSGGNFGSNSIPDYTPTTGIQGRSYMLYSQPPADPPNTTDQENLYTDTLQTNFFCNNQPAYYGAVYVKLADGCSGNTAISGAPGLSGNNSFFMLYFKNS